MILSEVIPTEGVWGAVAANTIGFFLTTMVCHGELAKDRPSTRYLTGFYLAMSFGGMLGGMFNTLASPLLFKSVAVGLRLSRTKETGPAKVFGPAFVTITWPV